MNLLSARDRLCLEREEELLLRLQCQREQERRRSEQTEVRQAGPDRRRVHALSHSVDPLAWSYIVRGPLCQLALNIKNLNFDITHQ